MVHLVLTPVQHELMVRSISVSIKMLSKQGNYQMAKEYKKLMNEIALEEPEQEKI
jgi:hypothetical protein